MKGSEIFQEIIERFYHKKDIEDEMLFFILDHMSEQFVESHDDSKWQTYDQMLDRLDKIWQYKQFEGLTSEQSYLYGGIWGCLSMLSYIKLKKEKSQKCYTIASKYEADSTFIFLNSIYSNPGLQNKKLAQICNVSSARISQIANEALKDGLISAQTLGKEKSYFIRTMGERVRDIVKKKKDILTKRTDNLDYKVIFFSNEENDFFTKYKKLSSEMEYLSQHNKVAIAIAYEKKQNELESINEYAIKYERKNLLWKNEMNNSYNNFMNIWNAQKEADLINQQ